MNKEDIKIENQQDLIKEHAYLAKEEKRLETVIDAQYKRVEIKDRMREIEEKLLKINVSLLKGEEYEKRQ